MGLSGTGSTGVAVVCEPVPHCLPLCDRCVRYKNPDPFRAVHTELVEEGKRGSGAKRATPCSAGKCKQERRSADRLSVREVGRGASLRAARRSWTIGGMNPATGAFRCAKRSISAARGARERFVRFTHLAQKTWRQDFTRFVAGEVVSLRFRVSPPATQRNGADHSGAPMANRADSPVPLLPCRETTKMRRPSVTGLVKSSDFSDGQSCQTSLPLAMSTA